MLVHGTDPCAKYPTQSHEVHGFRDAEKFTQTFKLRENPTQQTSPDTRRLWSFNFFVMIRRGNECVNNCCEAKSLMPRNNSRYGNAELRGRYSPKRCTAGPRRRYFLSQIRRLPSVEKVHEQVTARQANLDEGEHKHHHDTRPKRPDMR